MDQIDPKKQAGSLYAAKAGAPVLVDVPSMNFLMVDGAGDPGTSPAYQEAVQALFAVSYALKFKVRKQPGGVDYTVMPLEGLWWADDPSSFTSDDRQGWKWTMMIMQPDVATPGLVDEALAEVRRKKPLAGLDRVRAERFAEGRCMQVLHVGPFTTEGATIRALHDHIAASGAALRGKHHEIYLSDIRKADPSRWKTILRQPVE